MKLITLTAKNFKKLSNFTANFKDGLNVIVGENAQGKSTLLQAIEAALFGVTVVPGKKENIPTWGQTAFSLELVFEVENHAYVLTRTKSTAKLVAAGVDEEAELRANGNTPVTAYIEELLGLTAKDFNLFVQSKQGETSGVLTFGATALNNKVEEFAGISLIDDVKRRAQARATASKAAAEALAVSEDAVEDAEAAVDQCEDLWIAEVAKLKAAQAAVDNYPALIAQPPATSSDSLRAIQRTARTAEANLREAQATLAHKRDALAVAQQALAECGEPVEVENIRGSISDRSTVLKQKRARLAEVQEKLASALRAEEEYAEAVATLDAIEPVSVERLEEAERTHAHYVEEAARLREIIAIDKSKLATLRKLETDATCPTCGTALAEHDPEQLADEIAHLAQQVADLQVALSLAAAGEKEGTLTALRKQVEQSVTARVNVDKWAAKRTDASELNDLRAELPEVSAVVEAVQGEIADLKSKLENAEQANDRISAAEGRLRKASKDVQAAAEALEAAQGALIPNAPTDEQIAVAAQAEAAYRDALSDWQRGKDAAEHAFAMATVSKVSADREFVTATRRLGDLKANAEQAREHAVKAEKAGRLARFLGDRRQTYLQDVWSTVLAAASRQVQVATRGVITKIENGDDGFCFEEDGVMAPVASASGAQKAFIGSAVRIGLARALYGSDSLLIFDEPTESMSEKNASGLAASLSGAARQMLLITHREQDQGLAANIITVGV